MKRVIKAFTSMADLYKDKWYFGKEEFEKYGQDVYDQLEGCTVSKRRDLAYDEGGLAYEADMLGMDMFDLLRTLEGLCYNGMAREIDDSTYLVERL